MRLNVAMEGRPCVAYGDRRGMLHSFGYSAWTHGGGLIAGSSPAGQECIPVAIVEFEDGALRAVPVEKVRMLDSAAAFSRIEWADDGPRAQREAAAGRDAR